MAFIATKAYNNLQEIRWVEKSKLPLKGFLCPVTIDSTAGYNRLKMYRISENISEKRFYPSIFRRILILLFIGLFLFLFGLLINYPQKNLESYIIPIIFIVFFISFFLYEGFLNKKKNYIIVLNFDGIRIANEFYNWKELRETAILQIGAGRGQRDYLVLLFHNGTYKKYMTNSFLTLWGFKYALSSYIEYFKQKQ
jgi:hypothetical protein